MTGKRHTQQFFNFDAQVQQVAMWWHGRSNASLAPVKQMTQDNDFGLPDEDDSEHSNEAACWSSASSS